MLLGVMPFIALLFFLQQGIREGLHARSHLKEVHAKVTEAERLSAIVHELQKERGLSTYSLASRSKDVAAQLTAQESESDKRIEELGVFLKRAREDLSLMSLFSGLSAEREQVRSREATTFEVEDFYTSLIFELLDEINGIVRSAQPHEIKNILFAHSHLLYAKEYLGQMRAALGVALSAGALESPRIEKLVTLKRAYERNTRNFLQETTEDIGAFYNHRFKGPAVEATLETVGRIAGRSGEKAPVPDPAFWFESATASINILKEVEEYSIQFIKQHTLRDLETTGRKITANLMLMIGALALVSALSIVVCRTIVGRLERLQSSMTEIITTRDFSKRVEVHSGDEIGVISSAFNDLLGTVRETTIELERLSETDTLTQIYNRMKFNELLKLEVQRTRRYKAPLSIIMFDIDHFKKINDLYGHLVGDTVLVELAKTVKEHLRTTDVVARWGGEEFVILATETGAAGAEALAEKVRGEIEHRRFGAAGAITCSFGVSEYREDDDIDTLSKRADDALYEAKRSGRNRVCVK